MKPFEVRKDFSSANFIMLLTLRCRTSSDDLLCTREMISCSYPDVMLSRAKNMRPISDGTKTRGC